MAEATPGPLRVHLVHQSFGDYVSGLVSGIEASGDVELAVTSIASGAAVLGRPTSTAAVHEAIDLPRFRDPRSPLRSLAAVRRIVESPGEVIHWQAAGNPWVDAAFSLVIGRRPSVVTIHDMQAHPGDQSVLPGTFRAIRRLARRADQVTVHASHVKDQVVEAGVDPDRVSVIAHGELATCYRSSEELPLPPAGASIVLFFGRVQGYKGLDLLAEAMPLVREEIPDARLIVAGSGPSLDAVYPEAESVPEWVELHRGHIPVDSVVELFRRSAVVALPYREASQSGVAALAAGFGRTVVASRVPGLDEIVEDGRSGLLVEPNDPEALAGGLIRVLGDDELNRRLGQGADEAARTRLSWTSIGQELVEVYRRAATNAARTARR